MKISEERLADYDGRMNDWIASQGLLFQLTHAGTGLGHGSVVLGSIFRAFILLLLVAILALLAVGGYFFYQSRGGALSDNLTAKLRQELGDNEAQIRGFKRAGDTGSFYQILAEGNTNTFFELLEARRLDFKMGLLSGIVGDWDAGTISAESLMVDLKAGAVSHDAAQSAWNSLFETPDGFSFSKFACKDTNLSWGYSSPSSWGSITSSLATGLRKGDVWNLTFRGGYFSQGCFRNLSIIKLEVELHKNGGLVIPSAEMQWGEGKVVWNASVTEGTASPELAGEGTLLNVPTDFFLPQSLARLVEGTLNGNFQISGTPNNADGLRFDFEPTLSRETPLSLTNEIPIFQMLSALDNENSYRKVNFNKGELRFSSFANRLEFSRIDLIARDSEDTEDFVKLRGNFSARPITTDELARNYFSRSSRDESTSATIGEARNTTLDDNNSILTLFNDHQYKNGVPQIILRAEDEDGNDLPQKFLVKERRRKVDWPFVLEGNLEIAVPQSALQHGVELSGLLEPDQGNNLQWVDIPLNTLSTLTTHSLFDQWEKELKGK
ncbi:MAG: hypothetical protein AAGC74_11010 [Verrucomicrobiota bacterium]